MTVDVIMEDDRWKALGLEALADRAVKATLTHLGLEPSQWEIALLACDDARIAALNGDFREKPAATNVLSWPSAERGTSAGNVPPPPVGDPELGDIALSFDTCDAEARAGDKPLSAHVTHLIVHGVLHLLGYDHLNDSDADLMESTEIAILGKLGLENPYMG